MSGLSAAAKQQQLRQMMQQAKATSGPTAPSTPRVTDRLAKYDASGALSCAICKSAVAESGWTAHTQSKQHLQTLDSLRELARKKAGAGSVAAPHHPTSSTPAAPPAKVSSLSSGSVTTTTVVKKLAPTPTPAAANLAPAAPAAPPAVPAGLPADFFTAAASAAPSPRIPAATASPPTQPVAAAALGLGGYEDEDEEMPPAGGALPKDFFDTGATAKASPFNAAAAAAAAAAAVAAAALAAAPVASPDDAPKAAPVVSAAAARRAAQPHVAPGAAIKTTSAFVMGAQASINPLVASVVAEAKLKSTPPAAAAKSTVPSTAKPAASASSSSSSASTTGGAPPLNLTRAPDLAAELASFHAMVADTTAANEAQAKVDASQLHKLRRLNEKAEAESFSTRLADLKRASMETKKRLAEAKEEKAKKKAKIDHAPTDGDRPTEEGATSTGASDSDNPFLDWR